MQIFANLYLTFYVLEDQRKQSLEYSWSFWSNLFLFLIYKK